MPYDIVIGNIDLANLGMILDFKSKSIYWNGIEVSMRGTTYYDSKDKMFSIFMEISEPEEVQKASKRVISIIDSTYEKENLPNIIMEHCSNLSKEKKNSLLKLLLKYELFTFRTHAESES